MIANRFLLAGGLAVFAAATNAQWPVSEPVPVQEDRSERQAYPSVGMDASGRAVIVFEDSRPVGPFGTPTQITAMARLFDGAGVSSPTELLSPTGSQSRYPAVALARNGVGAVAWYQVDLHTPHGGLHGKVLNSIAWSWGPNIEWEGSGAVMQGVDSVAAWPDGNVAISTLRYDSLAEPLLLSVRRFNSLGLALTPVIRLTPAELLGVSGVAALPGGRFVVAWSSPGGDASGEGVRARIYGPSGELEEDEIAVNSFTAGTQQYPSVGAGQSSFVVVWESLGQAGPGYGVFAQRFDLAGRKVGAEFQVSRDPTLGYDAKVAMDSAGRFVVTWTSGSRVWVRAYRANGVPYGEEQPVDGGPDSSEESAPRVAISDAGVFTVAYESWNGDNATLDVLARRYALPCEADATTLCLHDGRFLVRAFTRLGETGGESAHAIPLTRESGAFWLFSRDNLELLVKVLDGCAVNGNFWVFAAGLTDREVQLVVTDLSTGTVRSFYSPGGTPFSPVQELGLFSTCAAYPTAGGDPIEPPDWSCAAPGEPILLGEGRFRVRASWQDFWGRSGLARGCRLGEQSALFSFFNEENVELVVKVLDGCAVNGRYWIYTTALTNVAVDLVVEDLGAGTTWRVSNPLGWPFPPIQDTNALASCPTGSATP